MKVRNAIREASGSLPIKCKMSSQSDQWVVKYLPPQKNKTLAGHLKKAQTKFMLCATFSITILVTLENMMNWAISVGDAFVHFHKYGLSNHMNNIYAYRTEHLLATLMYTCLLRKKNNDVTQSGKSLMYISDFNKESK